MDIFNEADNGTLMSGDKLTSNEEFYQFTVPFMIKLGITRPSNNGEYAQYLLLGGDGNYIQDNADGVVQIVWDGNYRRLVYTANGTYYNKDEGCSWDTSGETFDVTISIDSEYIQISSEFCDEALTASHNLATSQTSLSLGFINDGTTRSGEITEFSYIEVYQYPDSYAGNVVDGDSLSDLLVPTNEPSSAPTSEPTTGSPTESTDSPTSAAPTTASPTSPEDMSTTMEPIGNDAEPIRAFFSALFMVFVCLFA